MIDFSNKTDFQLKQIALRNANYSIKAMEELKKRNIEVKFLNDIKLLDAEKNSIQSREFGHENRDNLYRARCFLVKAIQALKEPLRIEVLQLEREQENSFKRNFRG